MKVLNPQLRPIFTTVFLIVCIASTTVTFLLPETYASTARIKVRNSWTVSPTDFVRVLDSEAFLESVVDRLALNDVWGKKYNGGTPFAENETVKILRARVQDTIVSEDGTIAITVYSDDSREAAQIANTIANGSQDYFATNKPTGSDSSHPVLTRDMIQILGAAVPGTAPVRPNKPLDISLGIVFGILIASGVTAVVGLLAAKGRVRVN